MRTCILAIFFIFSSTISCWAADLQQHIGVYLDARYFIHELVSVDFEQVSGILENRESQVRKGLLIIHKNGSNSLLEMNNLDSLRSISKQIVGKFRKFAKARQKLLYHAAEDLSSAAELQIILQ